MKDVYWCTQHKLETKPTFLCYMYGVKEGIDAKTTPADQMKCETCQFCCKNEGKANGDKKYIAQK